MYNYYADLRLFGNNASITKNTAPGKLFLKTLLLVLVLIGVGVKGWGQTTVTIGGGATVTCPATPTATWTTPPTGVTFSNWSRGSGVTCASAGTALSGSVFNTASAAAAYTANTYFSFTITADATHTFTLNSFVWSTAVSSGSCNFTVQYINNGGSLTTFGTAGQTSTSSNTFSGSVTVAAGTSIVVYAIPYGTGATGTTVRLANGSTVSVTAAVAATDYYWNGNNGSNQTSNIWSSSGSADKNWGTSAATWSGAGTAGTAWPNTTSYNANFSNTFAAAQTLAISGSVTANNTFINTSGYTFNTSGATGTIVSPIALGANTLTLSPNASYPLTLSGAISGTGGLTQNGAGTTVLSGTNTYTGATTISAGTLKIGNAAALGTGATSITSGAVLDLNGTTYTNTNALTVNGTGISSGGAVINSSASAATYPGLLTLGSTSSIVAGSGSITLSNTGTITGSGNTLTLDGSITGNSIASIIGIGAGGITKNGSGTWTLSGANTYTGATTINAGTLQAGNTAALGSNSAVSLANTAGAILNITGFSNSIGSLTGGGGTGGNVTLGSAALTIGGDNTSPAAFAGLISGSSGSIVKTGTGTLTLSNASNSYTGTTTINGGTLLVGAAAPTSSIGALGATATAVSLSASPATTSPSLLTGGAFTVGRPVTIANVSTSGTYSIGGNTDNNSAFSGAISISQPLTITQVATTSTNTLTVSGGISGTAQNVTVNNAGSVLINSAIATTSGTLTKSGAGTLTLSGTNTYTGATTINAGTLALSGSGSISSSSTITTASGATFDVTSLTSALALGSAQVLRASATGSNTTGTITVASSKGLTLGSTGGLAFTAYGGGATSPLTVTGASAGALALNGAPVTVTTTTALAVGTYTLIAQSGSATGVTGTPGTLTISGSGITSGASGSLSVASGQLILTVSANTTPPTLTAAVSATVDAAFNVTFTDDPTWRAATPITVTVGGTTLTAGYSISAGQITFTPSSSAPASLLQTAGSKSIVVTATGYTSASVTQVIGVGAANATQSTLTPTSASITADGSSTQILTVTAKDQYGNSLSTGGATVTITQSGGTGTIGSVTDNGNGTYAATVTSPTATGTGTFVATLGGAAVKSGTGSQITSTITYTAGVATKLIFTSSPVTTNVNTASSTITVQRQDANGNPNTTDASRAVTLSSNTSGTATFSPTSLTIANGSSTATFTYTDNTAGTPTITAASTSPTTITSATQAETVTATVPGAPTIGTATAGNAQASVTFTAPGSTGGSAITSYTVTASSGGFTGTGASSPITVTGLTNGTAYTFTVTATNAVGTSTASAASNSVTPVLPAPVTTAATSTTSTGFTANWGLVTGATSYALDVYSSTSGTILSENFSGFIASAGTTDRSGNLDPYTQTTGWTGQAVYENAGQAKLGAGSTQGYIITPLLDLSANGGNSTLNFDLQKFGSDVTTVQVYLSTNSGSTYTQIGSDITAPSTIATQNVSITGGTSTSKIKITAKIASNCRFYLDNETIQYANTTYVITNSNVGNVASYGVTGLTPSTNYSYVVRAVSASNTSSNSNVTNVTTASPIYYSKSTGNLDVLTNWGTNTDGSGTNPSNFTTNGAIYNIVNNTTPTIGAAWTVTGTSAKVVVGDGSTSINFTVPSTFAYTGTIDVAANATLTLQNTTVPTLGTLSTSSTVSYAAASGTQTITAATYGNLTLSGAGTRTFPSGTVVIAGIFTPGTGFTATQGTIDFSSTGSQTIPAFTYYTITNSGNGARTLGAGTVTISSSLFTPGSGTYTADVANTVIYAATSSSFTLTAALPYNNLTFTGGASYNFGTTSQTIANDLTISGGSTITIASGTSANGLSVGRDLLLGNNTAGTLIVVAGSSTPSITVGITRDFTISGTGKLNLESVSSSSGVATVNVGRDFTATSTSVASAGANGIVDFGTGTNTSNSINIARNFSKSGTGTFGTSGSSAATGFVMTGGTSSVPATFNYGGTTTSNYTQYTVGSGAYVQLTNSLTLGSNSSPSSSFTVSSTGTLDFQTYSIIAAGTTNPQFITSSGSTLVTSNTNGIGAVASTASGSLQSFGAVNTTAAAGRAQLATGVNYVFNGATTTPFTGTGTFGNPTNVTLGANVTLNRFATLSGTLALSTFDLTLNGATLTFSAITGSGTLIGDNAAFVAVAGSVGVPGTVRFKTGSQSIALLTMNRTGQTLTLGSDVTLDGFADAANVGRLILTDGVVNAVGRTVTFINGNTPIAVSSGTLTTDNTTSIVFGATSNLGGSTFTIPAAVFTSTPAVVSNFTVNRSNDLTLNSQGLEVQGALTLTAGIFNIPAGSFLNLNGASLSSTTGTLVGSSTSDLTVTGTTGGTVTIPTSSSITLRTVTVSGTRTLALNGTNDLNLAGVLSIASGATFDNGGSSQIGQSGGTGSISITGRFITRAAAGFFGSSTSISTGFTSGSTLLLNSGSTVEYGLSGNQTVQGSTVPSYQNVTFSGSGTKTLASTNAVVGTITVSGSAIFDAVSNVFAGASTNLTMTGTSQYRNSGSGLKPDATGTYTLGSGTTIEFYGSSATNIRVTPSYYNILVSGSNVSTTASGSVINMQSGSSFTVTGTFSHLNTNGLSGASNTAVSSTNSPSIVLNSGSTIAYTGSTQAVTPLSYYGLTIAGNGTKTLGGATSVATTLTLASSGVLATTSTNSLSITNTATTAITGGSTTAYISGPVKWTLPTSLASGSTYIFPVGKGGTYYPFSLVNPTTGATGPVFSVEAFASNAGGTPSGLTSLSTTEYWQTSVVSGNFTNTSVSLTRQSSLGSLTAIGYSSTAAGTYVTAGGTVSGTSVINSNAVSGSPLYFVLAQGCSVSSALNGSTTICSGNSTNLSVTVTGGTSPYSVVYSGNTVNSYTSGSNISVSPSTTTTYTLTSVTDATGCSSTITTATATVTVTAITWTGTTSTAWNVGSNWCSGSVPSSGADVIIANTSNQPVLAASTTVGSITLNTGATLTIGSYTLTISGAVSGSGTFTGSATSSIVIGGAAGTISFTTGAKTLKNFTVNNSSSVTLGDTLNITAGSAPGTVTVGTGSSATLTTGGKLILKSDSLGTARVATSTGTISGNVTVERYITAKSIRRYGILGSPVSGSTIRNGWQQQVYITGAGTGGTVCGTGGNQYNSNGFDKTQAGTPSMYTYSVSSGTASWASVATTTSDSLKPGTGYLISIRGDRNNGASCNDQLNTYTPTAPATVTLSATGTLTQGDKLVNLNTVHLYTLLANPYASTISFSNLYGGNSSIITNKMWTLTPSKTTYTTYSNGLIANGAAGGYDDATNGNAWGNLIGSGQAFFVEARSGSGGTVTFQESNKTDSSLPNTQYFGTASPMIRVRLKSAANAPIDEAVLRFNSNGSKAYISDWDAATMGNASQAIAVLKGNTRYAIATFPDNVADTTPLSINSTTANSFHLSVSGLETLDNSQSITLRDKFLATCQDLRANPVYAFNVTSDTASKGNNRFDIVFGTNSGTLPVNFTSITATENGGGVAVKWKVAQENNIASYNVERSVDGVSFAAITTVKATGSVSYTIQDNLVPAASALYYRIKAIEQSGGKSVYSQVAKLTLDNSQLTTKLSIYPNPVKSQLNLSLSHASNGSYTVRVVTVAGIEVLRQAVQTSGTAISINASKLASGVYMAELTNANGDKWMEKFVKE
ncbi:autotransporter-associated beta strand repeat-containing protein [Parasediminibacterium sp. JCM 36343]|uniref:autotransporter-associated beta strand repeat-containing protein n=1 Tax=Parasediminibacterium sp. JCM 36343 TaxID=3374279 RepID=UPI0039794BF1